MRSPVFLILIVVIVVLVAMSLTIAKGQTSGKQKQTSVNSKFSGTWKGVEKCKDVSAPVAFLHITPSGASEVFISGIYSIQGTIKGTVKGDTINIPKQEVKDPNFTNLLFEGTLVYSANPMMVRGNITVYNNQLPDECVVQYEK